MITDSNFFLNERKNEITQNANVKYLISPQFARYWGLNQYKDAILPVQEIPLWR